MKKQRGFINLDGLMTVFYLALVGIIAIAGALLYGIYLVVTHLTFA